MSVQKGDGVWLVPRGLPFRQWNIFLDLIGELTRSDPETLRRRDLRYVTKETGQATGMRNISFRLTEMQFRARSKTVTRRSGWKHLKPGDRLCGVRKSMGLKKGEKVQPLGVIEVVSVRRERLNQMLKGDCAKEGFPHLSVSQFIRFYTEHNGGKGNQLVTRIEFKYIDD